MGIKLIYESTLTDIANAIRTKNSMSSSIPLQAFPSAILDIKGGLEPEKVFQNKITSEDFSLPLDISYIGAAAFYGNGSLSIDLTKIYQSQIGDYAFAGTNIINTLGASSNFYINGSNIGKGIFKGCHISGAYFGGISTVGNYQIKSETFKDSDLSSFSIDSNRKSFISRIGKEAFANCSSLQYISNLFGSNISDVGERAFYGCSSLNGQVLLDTSAFVGAEAFAGCRNLIIDPEILSKGTCGERAFQSCKLSTSSMIILSTNINIGKQLFKDANVNLTSFHGLYGYSGKGHEYFFENATISFGANVTLKNFPEGFFKNAYILSGFGELSYTDSGTTFYNKAFYSTKLNGQGIRFTYGGSATIEKEAFAFCTLNNLSANEQAYPPKYYGHSAFCSCTQLGIVDFSRCSMSRMGTPCVIMDSAFVNCSALSEVRMTEIGYIGKGAFEGCPAMSNFWIYGSTVPILGHGNLANIFTFNNLLPPRENPVIFHVQSSLIDTFKSAPVWSEYFASHSNAIVAI